MDSPRDAAAVILARPRFSASSRSALEFLLLCRHRGSGFMANAYVFPGGVAEKEDCGDLRVTAARELFEEGGVLLSETALDEASRSAARTKVAAGEPAGAVLTAAGTRFAAGDLTYFAHWLTPSAEKRRYSAKFFIAQMPNDQEAQFDDVETVDQVWLTADEALERAGEFKLPPPQVRTFYEMRDAANLGWDALAAEARKRAEKPAIILPRFAPLAGDGGPRFALLLPWDRDYDSAGTGDALALPAGHPLAYGPSRFVLEDETWKNINAPATSE